MSSINKVLLYLIGFILLFPVQPMAAQSEVAVFCDETFDLSDKQMPAQFQGAYFYILSGFGNPEGVYRFARITQEGTTQLQSPFSAEMVQTLHTPRVSPDGRLMVFRPSSADTPLTIWDMTTDEVATVLLPIEESTYLNSGGFPQDWFQDKLIWIDSTHLAIQFRDYDTGQIEALTRITTHLNPLAITREPKEHLVFSQFPIPPGNDTPVTFLSPQEDFASVLSWASLPGHPRARQLQIFDVNTNTLVFDLPPSEVLLSNNTAPIWLTDESRVFFSSSNELTYESKFIELDALNGFVAKQQFSQLMDSTFGTAYSTSIAFRTNTSPDGTRIAFEIGGTVQGESDRRAYVIIYTPQTGEITAMCDPHDVFSTDLTYPVWSPDNQYFGIWDGGRVVVFDTQTGNIYAFPTTNDSFVGWVHTPAPMSTFIAITVPPTDGTILVTPTVEADNSGH